MKNIKMIMISVIIVIIICSITITFLTSIYIWWSKNSKEQSKLSNLAFSYLRAADIDPQEMTNDIMKAIGQPNAIPIVSIEDSFRVVLYNSPKEINLELHSFTGRFRFLVPGTDTVKDYQFKYHTQSKEYVVIDVTGSRGQLSIDQATSFRLVDLFSAIRDFPIESYREFTKFGNEKTDLYGITFNDGLKNAEDFFYDKNGYVQKNENKNEIPFIIIHLKWGEIRDHTLNYNDPHRYNGFGGEGRTNLFYILE